MFRVRLHGRGGQGIKTAGRILGSALFEAGYEVQDAPRFGAERRGAPIFSTVRASHAPIRERGAIRTPDLVGVADATLVSLPGTGVTAGLTASTTLLVVTDAPKEELARRIRAPGRVLTIPGSSSSGDSSVSSRLAGASARLLGVVPRRALEVSLARELGAIPAPRRSESIAAALGSFDAVDPSLPAVAESADEEPSLGAPDWVAVPVDPVDAAAPAIHAARNMIEVRTGLWRSHRPIVDEAACHGCVWICGTLCPDSAISAGATGKAIVDLDHCKGCLVCVAECPSHAIDVAPERAAARGEGAP